MRRTRATHAMRAYPAAAAASLALLLCATTALPAQEVNPAELVKAASYNELKASNGGHPFRYRSHKVDDGKVTTRLVVETKDGDIARLVEENDQPLSPAENAAELARLQNLYEHPEVQERKHKKSQEDGDRENEMIRLLPDAFVYHYEGTAAGPNGPVWRLSFKPNPDFQPPDREAEVYHGMEGELWVDKGEQRMVKLDAHLIADVNFGWGILGRLYKGGAILVEQKDVGNHHWEATHTELHLHGKALMLKALSFESTEDETDFHPVPDTGYRAAIDLLQQAR